VAVRASVTDADTKHIDAQKIAADIAKTAGEAARHARPTADDWLKLLIKASTYSSVGLAAWLSRPGPYNEGYELTDETAADMFSPLSRVISRSKFSQRWGHVAMQGGEYIDCVAAVVEYGVQIAPGMRAKMMRAQPPPPTRRVVSVEHRGEVTRTQDAPAARSNGVKPSADVPEPPPAGEWEPADHSKFATD
jgi:hypothetical protein